jgi:hypothetical protein
MLLLSSLFFHGIERPSLTAAQGMVESSLNPYAVGKVHELGAFQVRSCYWGRVPLGTHKQALQAQRILTQLGARRGIVEALTRYNGYGYQGKKYAGSVRRRAMLIEVLGVVI